MQHNLLDRLKQQWVILLGVFFLLLYLFNVPVNNQTLSTPVYHIDQLTPIKAKTGVPVFEDRTLQAGIGVPHTQRSEQLEGLHNAVGAGACLFDFDRDGWVDILTLNGVGTQHFFGKPQWWQSKPNRLSLYRNKGGGTFEDATDSSLLTTTAETMSCNAGDLDNDGDMDVFISNRGPNQLWRNNGDGTFSDITTEANMHGSHWSTSSRFGDVNRDGLLDIYVTNYVDFSPNARVFEENAGYDRETEKRFLARLYPGQANALYINQGTMQFTEVAQALGVANSQGRGLSANWLDINDDGWPDLLVANDQDSENKVYLNRQGKRFEDISTQSRLAITTGTPSLSTAKLHNDHHNHPLIFLSTKRGDHPRLFALHGANDSVAAKDISETQQLHTLGLSKTSWGTVAADFNGDGWLDLAIANGSNLPHPDAKQVSAGQPNTLLINNQQGGFMDSSRQLNPQTYSSLSSRCAASADFDNDGAPDLFFTQNNDLPQLLRNRSRIDHWIGFDLVNQDNRSVHGAVVHVVSNGITQTRYAGQHQGFLCSGDSRLLFALGDDPSVATITVIWPDGDKHGITGFQLNRYNRVVRDQSVAPIGENPIGIKPASSIRLQRKDHQLTIIGWLIDHERFSEANKELKGLTQDPDAKIREHAYRLAYRLPKAQRRSFISSAITDDAVDIRSTAIAIIQQGEDENLVRWLLHALSDTEPKVACAAAYAFEHFFQEEEAVTVRKYLSLDALIRLASGNNPATQACAIGALGESEHYRTLEVLIERLQNGAESVKVEAAHALGRIKEKRSHKPLLAVFESAIESPKVRAAAARALLSSDKGFNLKALIDHLFAHPVSDQEQGNLLQTLVLMATPDDHQAPVPASHFLPALKQWGNRHLNQSNPVNALRYLSLISQYPNQLTEMDIEHIKRLRKQNNPDIRWEATRLLLALQPAAERAELLVSALSDPALPKPAIYALAPMSLDDKAFYALSVSLPEDVRLTALWRFNAVGTSSDLQHLIFDTLVNPKVASEIKRSMIDQLNNQPTVLRALCDHTGVFSADVVVMLLAPLNGCLAANRLSQTMPALLQVALDPKTVLSQGHHTLRLASLKLLAARKERWARDYLLSVLMDEEAPLAEQEAIIAALPETLPPTLTRGIAKRFNQNPKAPIAALMIKYRHGMPAANVEQALDALAYHVDNGHEDQAMLFADALMATLPDRVLPILIKSPNLQQSSIK